MIKFLKSLNWNYLLDAMILLLLLMMMLLMDIKIMNNVFLMEEI